MRDLKGVKNMKEEKFCVHCQRTRDIKEFGSNKSRPDGLTSYCKDCNREISKEYQRSISNDFSRIVKNRWSSIHQRTANGKYKNEPSVTVNPQHQSYQRKGIEVEMSFGEFQEFMYSTSGTYYAIQTSGGIPTVDRIDDRLGYAVGNLQIISLHENIEKRLGKPCKVMSREAKQKRNEKSKLQYQINKTLRKADDLKKSFDEE